MARSWGDGQESTAHVHSLGFRPAPSLLLVHLVEFAGLGCVEGFWPAEQVSRQIDLCVHLRDFHPVEWTVKPALATSVLQTRCSFVTAGPLWSALSGTRNLASLSGLSLRRERYLQDVQASSAEANVP